MDVHKEFFKTVCSAAILVTMVLARENEIPQISGRDAKLEWTRDLQGLLRLRQTGTIGDVIDHLRQTHRPQVPDNVEQRENELVEHGNESVLDENAPINILRRLRAVKYRKIVALAAFINDETPFATKHGVKGAEFDNVLVVFGRGSSKYDFVQFLERAQSQETVPDDEMEMFERNRNLFYVVCSRPKKRLAIMFYARTYRTSDANSYGLVRPGRY